MSKQTLYGGSHFHRGGRGFKRLNNYLGIEAMMLIIHAPSLTISLYSFRPALLIEHSSRPSLALSWANYLQQSGRSIMALPSTLDSITNTDTLAPKSVRIFTDGLNNPQ